MIEGLCMCSRFVPVTEAAALAAAEWVGRGDVLAADLAARQAMAAALGEIRFKAKVVAGRAGQKDEAGLDVGDVVGAYAGLDEEGQKAIGSEAVGQTTAWELALAPLEGRDALARGVDGSASMLAAGPSGSIMPVPEMYMQKMVVCGQAADVININAPVFDNIASVAAVLGRKPKDLTIVVLDRPRHEDLIEQIKRSGARLKLIEDGDVRASIEAAVEDTGVDMYVGIGGSTEGIIAAAALRCLGGAMQARFWPVSRYQVEQVKSLGIEDVEARLTTNDMAGERVMVAITAVTAGRFLHGVEMHSEGVRSETLLLCSRCHKISLIKKIHRPAELGPRVWLWTR